MKIKNRRAHQRATALLPFEARRLRRGERTDLNCRISAEAIVLEDAQPLPLKDERLNAWLNMINTKLDYLISLNPKAKKDLTPMTVEALNISAGGMSMIAREPYKIGDLLEIRIVLQSCPPQVLYLYGNVVRVESSSEKSDRPVIGVKFQAMDKEIRDRLIKFDFHGNREKIIIKKGA